MDFISRLIDLRRVEGVGRLEPGPEMRALIDRIARIVSKAGPEVERRVQSSHADDEFYSFMWSSDPLHEFYKQRIRHYSAQQDKEDADAHQDIQTDAPAAPTDHEAATRECGGDLDPPTPPLIPRSNFPFRFAPGMSPNEFGLIKLTALFAARSGLYFRRALSKRVDKNPRFKFMSSTGFMNSFYDGVTLAYSSLVRYSDNVPDATLLKLFFHLAEMETVDLHGFVAGVDCFSYIENQNYSAVMPPPERLSAMMNRLKKFEDILRDPQPDLVPFTDLASRFPERWNTLKEVGIIKFTAQFVARYGHCFSRLLMKRVDKDSRFEFMKPTDGMYSFFSGRVAAYSKAFKDRRWIISASKAATILEVFFDRLQLDKLEEGVEMAMIDLHTFVGGLDCLADMQDEDYSPNHCPPPDRLSVMTYLRFQYGPLGSQLSKYRDAPAAPECAGDAQPGFAPIWDLPLTRSNLALAIPETNTTLEKIGIIKLTAQFVARYGPCFSRDLMKRVDKNPQFEFMKPTDTRWFDLYCGFFGAYATVLRPSKMLRKSDAPTATVVEGFFHHLESENLESTHAFVGGVDCLAYMENEEYSDNFPPPERLSVTMNRLKHMQPPLGSQRAQNQDGAQDIQPDAAATHECVGDAQPDLEPLPFRFPPLSLFDGAFGLDRDSLGIIKLTAQFLARYGPYFYWYLKERVDENPQFDFMKPSCRKSYMLFNVLFEAYSGILRRSDQLSDASTAATILNVFFDRLQLEKLEEGVEMAMIDLHAFVGGVDCFARMENEEYSATFPPREHLSEIMNPNRLTQMHPGPRRLQQLASFQVHPRPYVGIMLPEEPEPKRQKFGESELVPEDKFLSQHPLT